MATKKRCKEGFSDHGAICWKNTHIFGKGCCCTIWSKECCGDCPKGYKDDGCTCRRDVQSYAKDSYGRGLGSVLKCKENEDYDSGLCYDKCASGYKGIGPVCYQM